MSSVKDKNVIIIGKGPSVLDCTRNIISNYDISCITNDMRFEGWEKYIGEKFDYWFKNWTCPFPNENEIKRLGLKKVINITKQESRGERTFKTELPSWIESDWTQDLSTWILYTYGFDPSTGFRAFEYLIRQEPKTLACVGFDFFEPGKQLYYFDNRVQEEKSGHGFEEPIEYVNKRTKDFSNIIFRFQSHLKEKIHNRENIIFDIDLGK